MSSLPLDFVAAIDLDTTTPPFGMVARVARFPDDEFRAIAESGFLKDVPDLDAAGAH